MAALSQKQNRDVIIAIFKVHILEKNTVFGSILTWMFLRFRFIPSFPAVDLVALDVIIVFTNKQKTMSKITRRDFINGTLMVAGASMFPFGAISQTVLDTLDPLYYPPALTGLRGDHVGSYTHAHSRAMAEKSDWGPTTALKQEYDLVVVGGGISGLSAAFFYQQEHGKDKKV